MIICKEKLSYTWDELPCYYLLHKYCFLCNSQQYQMNHRRVLKQLVCGRLVIFEKYPMYNARVGMILSTLQIQEEDGHEMKMVRVFRVLTLVSEEDTNKSLEEKGLSVSDLADADLLDDSNDPTMQGAMTST